MVRSDRKKSTYVSGLLIIVVLVFWHLSQRPVLTAIRLLADGSVVGSWQSGSRNFVELAPSFAALGSGKRQGVDSTVFSIAGQEPGAVYLSVYNERTGQSQIMSLDFRHGKLDKIISVDNFVSCIALAPSGQFLYMGRAARSRAYAFGGEKSVDYDIFRLDLRTGSDERKTSGKYYSITQLLPFDDGAGKAIVCEDSKWFISGWPVSESDFTSAVNVSAIAGDRESSLVATYDLKSQTFELFEREQSGFYQVRHRGPGHLKFLQLDRGRRVIFALVGARSHIRSIHEFNLDTGKETLLWDET